MSEAFAPDWELDYYSRPILESDGKKRWELLICSTPEPGQADPSQNGSAKSFRWVLPCPATSVNSIWLKEALQQALGAAAEEGFGPPRRLRCWRGSMRTMVQRAAEGLGLLKEAFDRTNMYLKERIQFDVPIGSFQALQHRAAKMFCEIELTKSTLFEIDVSKKGN